MSVDSSPFTVVFWSCQPVGDIVAVDDLFQALAVIQHGLTVGRHDGAYLWRGSKFTGELLGYAEREGLAEQPCVVGDGVGWDWVATGRPSPGSRSASRCR